MYLLRHACDRVSASCVDSPGSHPRYAGPLLSGSRRQPPCIFCAMHVIESSASCVDSPGSHPRYAGPLLSGSRRQLLSHEPILVSASGYVGLQFLQARHDLRPPDRERRASSVRPTCCRGSTFALRSERLIAVLARYAFAASSVRKTPSEIARRCGPLSMTDDVLESRGDELGRRACRRRLARQPRQEDPVRGGDLDLLLRQQPAERQRFESRASARAGRRR